MSKTQRISHLQVNYDYLLLILVCGSFRNECENRLQEKNIIGGKEGEYPTSFTAVYTRFSSDICEESSLIYSVTASGPM